MDKEESTEFDRKEYDARPFVCDYCGYRVYTPCKTKEQRRNCEN